LLLRTVFEPTASFIRTHTHTQLPNPPHLSRGALATNADKEAVAALVSALEAAGRQSSSGSSSGSSGGGSPEGNGSGATSAAAAAPSGLLDGRWELLYANTEAFRNSPFFASFSNVVSGLADVAGLSGTIDVPNGALADAIFAFTDAIPGATIGAAYQIITPGALVSEVDLSVFPGLRGTVVTRSRLERPATAGGAGGAPQVLELFVESTRVERSNFSPLLDQVSVPVEQLVSGAEGHGVGWCCEGVPGAAALSGRGGHAGYITGVGGAVCCAVGTAQGARRGVCGSSRQLLLTPAAGKTQVCCWVQFVGPLPSAHASTPTTHAHTHMRACVYMHTHLRVHMYKHTPTRLYKTPMHTQIERLRGSEAARVTYEVTFLDQNLRVTRCGSQLLVHRRA
jgi:hypothetical protein